MKKIMMAVAAALAALSLAAVAFAGGSFSGKVTKVDGEKITVKADNVPAWVKKGANVQAMGGAPKVLSVKGGEIVLKFGKAKAAKIKVDSTLRVGELAGEELQGC
ncbi:selenite/tellurite reduction operon protein ExtJ [Geotalea sp. SG265]|uniref:selenite/tellurite reduction operon protein ExtJ n=1 Tax=Geotalea sp. SG265 TaxID=2922867 RepID=UPI001FAFCD4F|nr:selenite/tellurite reduction operon protein ExtJ [Geotalea sp. SG265]